MKVPLHILHLEDDPQDAALVEATLEIEQIPCKITRVWARQDFRTALSEENLNLILSDFSMPRFDGLTALELARKHRPEVPFIFLSGTIGEEMAIQALKEGATDYVLKDRMARLPVAIERAMQEAHLLKERKRHEEALRVSEERFRLMLESVVDYAIFMLTPTGEVVNWNHGAQRLKGYQAPEIVGKHFSVFHTPEAIQKGKPEQQLTLALKEGRLEEECWQVRKDGTRFWANVVITPIHDESQKLHGFSIVTRDLTERKRAEEILLRDQRVQTVGALAGGIAHDLNNALTPILMGVNILRQEPLTPEGKKMLELMRTSAVHGSEMVAQILSFSRGVGGQQVSVDLKQLVEEMVKLARKTFPGQIEIRAVMPADLQRVRGNPTQLHQVFLNLFVNARDAMPNRGSLTIQARNITLDAARLPAGKALRPGNYVVSEITDTGHGIPPEVLEKIFEPFFTTKEVGHGTGLGLSTVLGIIKTHGGFLDVSSQAGHGTTFRVYLPAEPAK